MKEEVKTKEIENKNAPDSNIILAGSALFACLCNLVPVPFLDSFLVMNVNKRMVASVLNLHAFECKPDDLYPLYKKHHGCLVKMIILLFTFPFVFIAKLVKKFLKWLFFILVIRDSALVIGKTILYGHTISMLNVRMFMLHISCRM